MHLGSAAQRFDRGLRLSVLRDAPGMVLLMNLSGDRRLLLAMIWAAIYWIALLFAATPAQAHPGRHAHDSAVTATATFPTSIGATSEAEARPSVDVQSDNPISILLVERAENGTLPNATCDGKCCGGAACCGTAAIVEPPSFAAPHRSGLRVSEPVSPATSGVEPEALPEPPRAFA